jgi:V8-like Glu-specific endopeptidase
MVDPQRGIADLGSFAARMLELLRQVCAVELGEESGTGFLIGPDTVLTNYHVVESAIAGGYPPRHIQLRFDYQRLRDGVTTNGGKVYPLADRWLVHASRYSDADTRAYDAKKPPGEDELDYAVLRTKDQVGADASSGVSPATRGWITPRRDAYGFPDDSFLMIVQHPCHDPLSYDEADNAVIRLNSNRTRIQYRTNTMPGSSGSPVLDRHLDLVALHHAGEPGSPDGWLPCREQVSPAHYNEGIPIALIQAHLLSLGQGSVFGGSRA